MLLLLAILLTVTVLSKIEGKVNFFQLGRMYSMGRPSNAWCWDGPKAGYLYIHYLPLNWRSYVHKKKPDDNFSISKYEFVLLWMQWMHWNDIESSSVCDHQISKKQHNEELVTQTEMSEFNDNCMVYWYEYRYMYQYQNQISMMEFMRQGQLMRMKMMRMMKTIFVMQS